MIDFSACKEASQRYAKSADGADKKAAGQDAIQSAQQICGQLLLSLPLKEAVFDSCCQVLSYPLAHAVAMSESHSLAFLESFAVLLANYLEVNYTIERKSCDKNENIKPNSVHVAKCVTHLAQQSAQRAAACSRSISSLNAPSLTCLIRCLHVVLNIRCFDLVSLTLSSDQVVGLNNFLLDSAFALCGCLEGSSAPAIDLNALKIFPGSKMTPLGSVSSVLRAQALTALLQPSHVKCTFSYARAFEVNTRALSVLLRNVSVSNNSLSHQQAMSLITEVDRFVVSWSHLAEKRASAVSHPQELSSLMQDILRGLLWLLERSAYFEKAKHADQTVAVQNGTVELWVAFRPLPETVVRAVAAMTVTAPTVWREQDLSKVKVWADLCKALMATQKPAETSGVDSSHLFGSSTLYCDPVSADALVVLALRILAVELHDTKTITTESAAAKALLQLARTASKTCNLASSAVVGSKASAASDSNTRPSATCKAHPATGTSRSFARICAEGLSLCAAACKASQAPRPTMVLFAYATAVFHALAMPHLWTQSVDAPAVCSILKAIGHSLTQVPLPVFQQTLRQPTISYSASTGQSSTSNRASSKVRETGPEAQSLGEKLLAAATAALPVMQTLAKNSATAELADTLQSMLTMLSTRCSLTPTSSSKFSRIDAPNAWELESMVVTAAATLLATALLGQVGDVAPTADTCRLLSALAAHTMHALSFAAEAGAASALAADQAAATLAVLETMYKRLTMEASPAFLQQLLLAHASEFTARAAIIVRCPAALDACVALVAVMCPAGSATSGALGEGINLYVSSYFCWAGQLGPASELGASMIQRIKTLTCLLDPVGEPSVKAVTGARLKGRKKSTAATSVTVPLVDNSQHAMLAACTNELPLYLRHALSLRMWLLLARWSAPVSTDVSDQSVSDGKLGVSVYITNALCALQCCGEALRAEMSPEIRCCSEETLALCCLLVAADAMPLYYALGLHGRTADQREMVQILQQWVSENFCKNASAAAALELVCAELALVHAMQVLSDGGQPTVIDAISTASAGRLPDWFNRCQEIISSASRTLLRNAETEIPVDFFDSFSKAAESAWTGVGVSRADRAAAAYVGQSSPSTYALKAWFALICSKVCAYACYNRQAALKWARRALGAATQGNQADKSKDEESADNGRPGTLAVGLETAVVRLDALLLLAEQLEQVGSLDAALACAAEALAVARLGSRALQSGCAVPLLRMWERTGSSRLTTAVSEILYQSPHSVEELRDDVTVAARDAVRCLAWLLQLDAEDEGHSTDAAARASYARCKVAQSEPAQFRKLLYYKYAFYSWNVPALLHARLAGRKATPGGSNARLHDDEDAVGHCSSVNIYHTCLPPTLRAAVDTLLPSDRSSSPAPTVTAAQALPTANAVGAFDALRDLRRRACDDMLYDFDGVKLSSSLHAWLLGAASCGVSFECGAEGDTHVTHKLGARRHASTVSVLLQQACVGHPESLQTVDTACDNILQNLATASDRSAITFLCLERSGNKLLVGRMDTSGPLVVSLPCGAAMKDLLQDWHTASVLNKDTLQQTLDPESVARWSDDEKRRWWKQRESYDTTVQTLLARMQTLLGAWRCLLTVNNGGELSATAISVSTILKDAAVKLPTSALQALGAACVLLARAVSAEHITRDEALAALKELLIAPGLSRLSPAVAQQLSMVMISACMDSIAVMPPATPVADDINGLCDDLINLRVTELREQLKRRGLPVDGTKAELLGRLTAAAPAPAASVPATASAPLALGHALLLLDEALQALPIENLKCLRQQQCSRLPGLALTLCLSMEVYAEGHAASRLPTKTKALDGARRSDKENASDASRNTVSPLRSPAKGRKADVRSPVKDSPCSLSPGRQLPTSKFRQQSGLPGVRLTRAWYVVDPEANLPGTRATMQAFLRPYSERYDWRGYVAEVPPEPTVRSAHDDNTLFIFCGHGAAEQVCEPRKLRKCYCPAAMLWGCSSGLLTVRGVHDPCGAALGYLINGAPYALANLWDVTDKDIDKLSVECMKNIFDSAELECQDQTKKPASAATLRVPTTVAAALAQSRNVCKMGYAVGAAPVMYGLPIHTLM